MITRKATRTLYLLALCLLTIISCTKDSTPKDPVDTLPPITQTGENTFACLINGKPFFSTYKKRASYTISKGGYTIALSGSRQDDEGIKTVSLVGLDIEDAVSEMQYKLESENSGHFYGRYAIYDIGVKSYATTDENPGLLTITALNLEDGFISGVFEFIAEDEHGNTLNFTHGRFDLKF